MKHGPMLPIDSKIPLVAIALKSSGVYEKMLNNIEEVIARNGKILAVIEKGDKEAGRKADSILEIPAVSEDISPMLSGLPLQLIAYEIARLKKREIDQPRNLAKSVR